MRSICSMFFALAMLLIAAASNAQYLISVDFGPPALPVYEQPPCPGQDYIWTPGYWSWSPVGYYWTPGTWVEPPEPDLYWTPGYWAYDDNLYYWNDGYWAPEVGYYGGIDYGYGYSGMGYDGGYWRDRHFYYNQAVNNVPVTIVRYVYVTRVVNDATAVNRVSYNGGPGGTTARPTGRQQIVPREQRRPPTPVQQQHVRVAREDRSLLASENQGKPPVAATAKPAQLKGSGVTVARQAGAPWHPPANRENRGGAAPATQPDNRANTPEGRRENRNDTRPDNATRPDRTPDNEAPRREAEPRRTAPPDATPDRNEPRANPEPRPSPEERDRRAQPSPAPRSAPEERERTVEPAPRQAPEPRRTEPEPRREQQPPPQAQSNRPEPPRNERANEVRQDKPARADKPGRPDKPDRPNKNNKPEEKDKKSPPEADDNRPH